MNTAAPLLLVVDDDPLMQELILGLASHTFERSLSACTGQEALAVFEREDVRVVLLDLGLPDIEGRALLRLFRERNPEVVVVVVTANGVAQVIQECLRLGATDYLTKPIDPVRFQATLQVVHDVARLRQRAGAQLRRREGPHGLARFLGQSPGAREVRGLVRRVANSDATVLFLGESGTGKEVLARALHEESNRSLGPFVAVNCGAIPDSLVEAQLFGHEKGAFTGADRAHAGFFEQADGGTIFLDEIAELRPEHQVRLLRVLQERRIRRVGAGHERPVDVRVVAATHRSLDQAMASGAFRQDLYYRLAVFPVELPPLRERQEDILPLTAEILSGRVNRDGAQDVHLDPEVEGLLVAHSWPGNVRELENVLQRAALLAEAGRITGDCLPALQDARRSAPRPEGPRAPLPSESGVGFGDSQPVSLDEHDRRICLAALQAHDWQVSRAARSLGLGRATLYRRIKKYGLQRPSLD